MIHMKYQDSFSLKNKKKKQCRLLQILHGILRVKCSHKLNVKLNYILVFNAFFDEFLTNQDLHLMSVFIFVHKNRLLFLISK